MSTEKPTGEDESDGPAQSLQSQIFWFQIGALVLAVIAAVMFGAGFYFYFGEGLEPNELGDFWSGGVGPLLSFAALIILYVAFLGQKQQLQLQQQELKATRQELAGQRKQLELQNQQTEQRNFENTFFQLIRLHNDIVDSIDTEVEKLDWSMRKPLRRTRTVKGRDCFRHFYEDLKDAYSSVEVMHAENVVSVLEESTEEMNEEGEQPSGKDYEAYRDIDREKLRMRLTYEKFWSDKRADLEHYFQSLQQVLKHVVEREQEDTEMYIDIVLAQLSTYELLLLAYHYLCGYAPPRMKRYINDYDVLRHMPSGSLMSEEHILAIDAELSK